jgi:hypothetical protein
MSDTDPVGRDGETGVTPKDLDTPDVDPTTLDAVVQAHIGRELRALFDEIVHEPVPDRFLQLLQALEAKKTDSK